MQVLALVFPLFFVLVNRSSSLKNWLTYWTFLLLKVLNARKTKKKTQNTKWEECQFIMNRWLPLTSFYISLCCFSLSRSLHEKTKNKNWTRRKQNFVSEYDKTPKLSWGIKKSPKIFFFSLLAFHFLFRFFFFIEWHQEIAFRIGYFRGKNVKQKTWRSTARLPIRSHATKPTPDKEHFH